MSQRSPLPKELAAKIIQVLLSGPPLGEVEAWIYGSEELEAHLARADYLALISLDFTKASSWEVIEKTLSRYIGRAALAAEKRRDLDRLAACYLRYQRERRGQDFWAVDLFFHTVSPEEKWELICAVIERASLPGDRDALGVLGAGPLEDLMSDWLLEQISVPLDPRLREALSMVRMEFESSSLQERLKDLLKT